MVWVHFGRARCKHQIDALELRFDAVRECLVVDQASVWNAPELRRLESQNSQGRIGFRLSGLRDGLALFIGRKACAIGQDHHLDGCATLLQQSSGTTASENFIIRVRRKDQHLLRGRQLRGLVGDEPVFHVSLSGCGWPATGSRHAWPDSTACAIPGGS